LLNLWANQYQFIVIQCNKSLLIHTVG
jgi:hypothetical protein